MKETERIVKRGFSSGWRSSTAGSSITRDLPPELIRQAARRLAAVAILYAVAFLLAYFPGYVTARLHGEVWHGASLVFAVASILLAVVVALVAGKARLSPPRLIAIGAFFEVIGAFGIGAAESWGMFESTERLSLLAPGISWICVWIILFSVILPGRPKHALGAALLTAAMGPLAHFAAWLAHGSPFIPPEARARLFLHVLPNFICAVMAFFACGIVYRLGRDVRRARELGSYRLTEPLGRGGMGEVWRAEHRLLARPAAIKLIRPDRLGPAGDEAARRTLARFEREAQATATLRSPHAIDLYDFGRTGDGSFYYVMELLDGLDLETLVRRFGPLPAPRTVFLLRQVCHALREAHRKKLIHRDIKPANIFACRFGADYDFLKILDFGLVKPFGSEGFSGDPDLSDEGMPSGTPAFLAPETALGREDADERIDLYGVGCVGYWLLTGRFVFDGNTPMEIIVQHIKDRPAPPSDRTEIPVPPDLERTILACLEKEPADRPASAEELDRLLAACRMDEVWDGARAARWWNTHLPRVETEGSVDRGAPVRKVDPGLED